MIIHCHTMKYYANWQEKINELIDIINETGNTISEETAQRSEADTQLQNNINTEKTARENADAQLQTNIDTLSNNVFHKNQVVPIANGGTGANNKLIAIRNLTNNIGCHASNGIFYLTTYISASSEITLDIKMNHSTRLVLLIYINL